MLPPRYRYLERVLRGLYIALLVSVVLTGLATAFTMTPSHIIGGFLSAVTGLTLGIIARS